VLAEPVQHDVPAGRDLKPLGLRRERCRLQPYRPWGICGDAALDPDLWDFCGDATRLGDQRPREATDGSAAIEHTDPLWHCIP
jgi:hypothetical protein